MDESKRIKDMHPKLMCRWELLLLNSIYGKTDMRSPYQQQQQLKLSNHNIKDVTPKGE